jgi:hypothetical protein
MVNETVHEKLRALARVFAQEILGAVRRASVHELATGSATPDAEDIGPMEARPQGLLAMLPKAPKFMAVSKIAKKAGMSPLQVRKKMASYLATGAVVQEPPRSKKPRSYALRA